MSGNCFSDNSYLSGRLDRQGLMVAARAGLMVAHLGTKSAVGFSPQALQSFWSKIEFKNPKRVVMSPTVFAKYTNQKEAFWQQYHLCLARAECQILTGKHFIILRPSQETFCG